VSVDSLGHQLPDTPRRYFIDVQEVPAAPVVRKASLLTREEAAEVAAVLRKTTHVVSVRDQATGRLQYIWHGDNQV
jgi:hypothetical protein